MALDYELRQDLLRFLHSLAHVSLPSTFAASREKLLKRMVILEDGEPPGEYVPMSTQHPEEPGIYVVPSSSAIPPSPSRPSSPSRSSGPRTQVIKTFLHEYASNNSPPSSEPKAPTNSPERRGSPSRPATYFQPLPPLEPPPIRQPCHDTQSPTTNVVSTISQDEPEIVDEIDDSGNEEIYAKTNAQEAKEKAQKFDQLRRKEKRRFFFESTRLFWAALLDAYILCYDSPKDPEPTQVLPLRGSTCRPLNAEQSSPKKLVDSTFEICLKDNRSFQFIASAPKDRSQWMAAIRRAQTESATANKASQPVKATPKPVKLEPCQTDRNSNGEYEDLVITNIQGALNFPPKTPVLNNDNGKSLTPSTAEPSIKSKSPNLPQNIPVKNIKELPEPKSSKPGRPEPPPVPNRILRQLPSLPLSEKSQNEDKDMVYSLIPEENDTNQAVYCDSDAEREDVYDDIDNVKREVRLMETRNVDVEQETTAGVQESEGNDTYDDVEQVKEEVQNLRKIGGETQNTAENENEKQAPKVVPKTPTKSSPFKSIFGRIMQKTESPQKGDSRKNPTPELPQRNDNISAAFKLPLDRNQSEELDRSSEELDRSDVNTEALDGSDYNSPPPPRPVLHRKPLDHKIEEEQMIYDDIGIKNDEPVNCIVKPVKIVDNKQKTDALLMNNKSVFEKPSAAISSYKKFSNVVCNLNETFEREIYQNGPIQSKLEESSEHYQIPKNPDGDAQMPPSNGQLDSYDEEIYDDVGIVAQKKRASQEAKSKPMVQLPSKAVWTKAKTSDINSFGKTNKFPSFKPEESSSEKKVRQIFGGGKKFKMPQTKALIIKHEACHNASDIYDDCR